MISPSDSESETIYSDSKYRVMKVYINLIKTFLMILMLAVNLVMSLVMNLISKARTVMNFKIINALLSHI